MPVLNQNLTFTGDMLVSASDPRWAAWPVFATLSSAAQTALILDASQMVENHCRRTFQSTQVVIETLDGHSLPRIWLTVKPVISITSVTVNQVPLDNTYNDAWTFNPVTGELIRGDGMDAKNFVPWFPDGTLNVQVVYLAGFSAVPGPVMRATVLWARIMYELVGVSQLYASKSLGDYSFSLNPALTDMECPPQVAMLLAPYMSPPLVFV